jgi:hypothetical protein
MKLTKLLENSINEKIDLVEASLKPSSFVKLLPKNKQALFEEFYNDIPANELKIKFNALLANKSIDKEKLAKAFKSKKSIDDLNDKSYKDFYDLWKIQGGGCGPGELYIMFLVNGATAQGPSESFDIEAAGEKYEVKALDVGQKGVSGASIRPGAEGKVSRFPTLTNPLMEFFKLVTLLQDPQIQSSVLTLGDADQLRKILNIINDIQVIRKAAKVNITQTPGEVNMELMDSAYKGMLALKGASKITLNKDVTTSRLKVKSGKIDAAYWITPDDVDDIAAVAGKDKEASIKVGMPITDETKEARALFADLFNHPFVRSPKLFVQELSNAKNVFMKGGEKSGIIYFSKGITKVDRNFSEFATINSSGDAYRFNIKSLEKYQKYSYIQDQP